MGTGIALPQTHPVPTTPGTPPPYHVCRHGSRAGVRRSKCGVGLKSVAQLTLRSYFSGFQGITEVYNLVYAGNANDHFVIPGNK